MNKENKENNKKIVILNYMDILNPQSGGAERYCHEMAKRLAKDGYDVIFISALFPGAKKEEEYCGYTIKRTGSVKSVYFLAFFELLKIKNIYIIFESINAIPFLFTVLFHKKKIRMIHHIVPYDTIKGKVHNSLISLGLYVLQIYITPMIYKKSKVITSSKSTSIELNELGYKDVNIVKLGIDIPKNINLNKENIILAPGPVKPWKNIDDIIKAFSKIDNNFKLYIFGNFESKEYENFLRNLVTSLNLNDRVIFFGRISEDEKNTLFEKAYITVIASEKEGWGLVAMESQAYGTPVIAYDVPGIRDSVINMETGILVPYKNIDALADNIKLLIDNKDFWKKLSKSAIERSKLYGWDECYKDFRDLIQKI